MPPALLCKDRAYWVSIYNAAAVDRASIERRIASLDAAIAERKIDCAVELAGIPEAPNAKAADSKPVNCFPNQFTGGVTCM
jgi:hypothetical protein